MLCDGRCFVSSLLTRTACETVIVISDAIEYDSAPLTGRTLSLSLLKLCTECVRRASHSMWFVSMGKTRNCLDGIHLLLVYYVLILYFGFIKKKN